MHIRRLTEADAAALRELRVRAVREHPDAFLVAAEDEERTTVADWAARLREKAPRSDDAIHGAFLDAPAGSGGAPRLVGMVGFFREPHRKLAHKAVIWGMYVAPEARGGATGRALLDAALAALRAVPDIEIVNLSVVVGNEAARALYLSAGFEHFGLERDAWKLGGRYLDEEMLALRLRPR